MVHLSTTAQRLVQPTTWQAGVIWGVTTTNASVGFIQESKAEEAIAALSKAVTTEATVIRNGAKLPIPSSEPEKSNCLSEIVCFFKDNIRPTLTQQAIPVLEAFVFATILCGFFGIILKKNLVMKIISMDVMSTGVIAYYVLIASRDGLFTPIVSDVNNRAYADPVPQAVILTGIVIGFSIQCLMLVGVMKLARDNPTLESNEIEKSNTP